MTTVRHVTSEAEAREAASQLAEREAWAAPLPPERSDDDIEAEVAGCGTCQRSSPTGSDCSVHWRWCARRRARRKAEAAAILADADREGAAGGRRRVLPIAGCLLCGTTDDLGPLTRVQGFVPGLREVRGRYCHRCLSAMDGSGDDVIGWVVHNLRIPASLVRGEDLWAVRALEARRRGEPDPEPPGEPWAHVTDVPARLAGARAESPAPTPEPEPDPAPPRRRRLIFGARR